MKRVAILKPDHLGDLILSAPAIRAILGRFEEVRLYVAPGSAGLARYLFPQIADLRTVTFQHLSRKPVADVDRLRLGRELGACDYLFCLRDDDVMREVALQANIPSSLAAGGHLTHETAIQKRAIVPVIGNYSRTEAFSGGAVYWPTHLRRVALCIAAGFPTNRWPLAYWYDLARLLLGQGITPMLVGGPGERKDLAFLSRMLGKLPHRVVEGGADFGAFLDQIEEVDLVVASDGGTAHMCSLRKPVCSVFGSSSWRRYAPFGRENVLLTRDEPCSPCMQFATEDINTCVSRECTALLTPSQVMSAVMSNGMDFTGVTGVRIERGVSHTWEN